MRLHGKGRITTIWYWVHNKDNYDKDNQDKDDYNKDDYNKNNNYKDDHDKDGHKGIAAIIRILQNFE